MASDRPSLEELRQTFRVLTKIMNSSMISSPGFVATRDVRMMIAAEIVQREQD